MFNDGNKDGDPIPEPSQATVETDVDSKFLDALGIDAVKIDAYVQTQMAQEKPKFIQVGLQLFENQINGRAERWINIGDTSLELGPGNIRLELIPDLVIRTWNDSKEKYPDRFSKPTIANRKREAAVKAIIEGFGSRAIATLENPNMRDLPETQVKCAINAFDLITEGGITNCEPAMKVLRSLAEKDTAIGIRIAKMMQEREAQKSPSPQEEPKAPDPIPTQ